MNDVEGTVAPEATISSEPVAEVTETVESDTTPAEQVAERTDEQKNTEVQQEEVRKAERKARGVQKRLDELTADKYAERKRADDLAAQNARILALLEGQKAPAQSTDDAPQREQFADDFSFVRADAAYVAKQQALKMMQEAQAQQAQQYQQMQRQQAERQATAAFIERQKAIEKQIPDFRETLEDADIAMPEQTLQMIRYLPDGPMVAYHIAKNPDLAAQFSAMPSQMHGYLLGQISSSLKSAPQVSKAPPPGKPVQTKPGSSNEPPSNPDEYAAWAAKHMR